MAVKPILPSIRVVPLGGDAGTLRLSQRDREHLAGIATLMHVGPGSIFYERGREAGWMYNIVSGTVCTFRRLDDGAERITAFLFAEDLFGLARRGRYVNSARAVTPVSAFRLPLESLTSLLLRDASLQFRFLCKAAHALRETQRRALILTRHDPVERVAMFLALMEEAQGDKRPGDRVIALPMNRRDIGSFLNLTTGAVDAALGALAQRGVIGRLDDGSVIVLNRERFQAAGFDD
jgi:cAMP-binding proteins - catabolite gene activator and regulatory subunit of cAMP-dependent protein kinases